MPKKWIPRLASNLDCEELVELIDGVYREYGDEADLEGFDRDLLDVEEAYRGRGGEMVVLEEDGRIVGAHATLPVDGEAGYMSHPQEARLIHDAAYQETLSRAIAEAVGKYRLATTHRR